MFLSAQGNSAMFPYDVNIADGNRAIRCHLMSVLIGTRLTHNLAKRPAPKRTRTCSVRNKWRESYE